MKILQSTIERLLYVVLFLIFILSIVLMVLTIRQARTLNQQASTLKNIIAQDDSLLKGQQNQIDQTNADVKSLSNHIDCIIQLFQQPDRMDLSISNIQNCQIVQNPAPAPTVIVQPSAPATPSPITPPITPKNKK